MLGAWIPAHCLDVMSFLFVLMHITPYHVNTQCWLARHNHQEWSGGVVNYSKYRGTYNGTLQTNLLAACFELLLPQLVTIASDHWRAIIGSPWLLIVVPSKQSEYAKLQSYFDVFWDRTLILHTSHQRIILHSLIFFCQKQFYHTF